MIVWQGHGYRIEEHRRAFGDRMPLPYALDRLDGHHLTNIGWFETIDQAHRARNRDVELRTQPCTSPTPSNAAQPAAKTGQQSTSTERSSPASVAPNAT